MTEEALFIVDVIGAVAASAGAIVLPKLQVYDPSITGVYYEYGHTKEILQTLYQKETPEFQDTKYPLIALLQDFTEDRGTQPGIYCETDLTLLFCFHSDPAYKSKERYEKTFKPVLYPIYLEFIEQLKVAGIAMFETQEVPHKKTDHPFYGADGAKKNAGNDFLDVIELSELKLKLYQKNC